METVTDGKSITGKLQVSQLGGGGDKGGKLLEKKRNPRKEKKEVRRGKGGSNKKKKTSIVGHEVRPKKERKIGTLEKGKAWEKRKGKIIQGANGGGTPTNRQGRGKTLGRRGCYKKKAGPACQKNGGGREGGGKKKNASEDFERNKTNDQGCESEKKAPNFPQEGASW